MKRLVVSPKCEGMWSLIEEQALNLLFAGTDTTANAIETGVLHIFSDERVKKKLLEELIDAYPEKETPVAFEVVEKLPYLVRSNQQSQVLTDKYYIDERYQRVSQAEFWSASCASSNRTSGYGH